MKIKNFFKMLLAGMGIGVASAIPGVSGGTISVILKVYDKIVNAVSGIFKHFKKSIVVLLPILLGVVLAIVPCIYIFDKAFQGFVFGIVSLFAGFIIGSFPGITDEVRGVKIKPIHIVICVISFAIAVGLGISSVFLKLDVSSHFAHPEWWFYLILIPVGMLAAITLVVPGISGSMVLLVLGFYTPLLEYANIWVKEIFNGNFANFWIMFGVLGCFAVGVIGGIFTISKIMSFLLNKYRSAVFYGIIGFVLGSTITLYFNFEIYNYYVDWASGHYVFMPMWLEIVLGIVLLAGGVAASYMLVRYERKQKLLDQQALSDSTINKEGKEDRK